ncbi:hypothetical protein AAFC00_002043 [Neodothiora populina]|uniref:Stc1 domain-containing protein n=1 Tax=Neodothiora populina TaxID=2781224 RepID=A0ABR3PG45_9PEZI
MTKSIYQSKGDVGTAKYRGEKHKLPDRLPCAEDGALKPQTAFSSSRLRVVQSCGMDSAEAMEQLICLEHTGAPPTELLCNGPCGLTKSLNAFSRTQRTQPDLAICQRCMYFREQSMPGHIRDGTEEEEDEQEEESQALVGHGSAFADSYRTDCSSVASTFGDAGDVNYERTALGPLSTRSGRFPAFNGTGSALQSYGLPSVSNRSISDRGSRGSTASGPWARIRAAPRLPPPVPEDADYDVECASDEDQDWEM